MSNNAFTAADALSSAAVDDYMGEQMLLKPWLSTGRYSKQGAPDPDRPTKEFRGTYGGSMGQQKLGGDRPGNQLPTVVATKDRIVTADFRNWPAYAVKGDRIQLLEQAGEPDCEIERIGSDGMNRVVVKLVLV